MSIGTTKNINDLFPPELLDKVFVCLSFAEQVNGSQVCQLWHDVIYDRFNSIKYLEFDDVAQQLVCSEGSKVFRSVCSVHVVIGEVGVLSDVLRLMDGRDGSSLHVVYDLRYRVDTWPDDTLTKATTLHGLHDLQLEVAPYADQFIAPFIHTLLAHILTVRPTILKVIKLSNVRLEFHEESSRRVVELVGNSPKLCTLVFNNCIINKKEGKKLLSAIPKLSQLEMLDLRDSNVETTKDLVNALGENDLKGVTFVGLSGAKYLRATSGDLSRLAKCPRIKSIMVGEFLVESADSIRMLKSFTYVRKLRVSLTKSKLRTLATTAANCKVSVCELDVRGSRLEMSDELLQSLVLSLSASGALRKINASWCSRLSNQGVVDVISAAGASISALYLRGVEGVSSVLLDLLEDAAPRRSGPLEVLAWDTTLSMELRGETVREAYFGDNNTIFLDWSHHMPPTSQPGDPDYPDIEEDDSDTEDDTHALDIVAFMMAI